MDSEAFDNDIFIELVKKEECLWNTSCMDYHNKIKKRNAWHGVCCAVYPAFKEKTEKQQKSIGEKLMKKWKNIRDAYLRSVKKKTNSGQAALNRTYIFARQLEFLATTCSPSPTVSSLDDETEDQGDGVGVDVPGNEEEMEDTEAESSMCQDTPSVSIAPSAKRTSDSSFMKLPANKRRIIVEEKLLDFIRRSESTTNVQNTPHEPDDDRSYFESLLPIVKTLPIETKLDFRVRVMGILKEMRAASKNAPADTVAAFPRQNSQQSLSDFMPIVSEQYHQQPVGPHSTTHHQPSTAHQQPIHFTNTQPFPQTTQQKPSFHWESTESSNESSHFLQL